MLNPSIQYLWYSVKGVRLSCISSGKKTNTDYCILSTGKISHRLARKEKLFSVLIVEPLDTQWMSKEEMLQQH